MLRAVWLMAGQGNCSCGCLTSAAVQPALRGSRMTGMRAIRASRPRTVPSDRSWIAPAIILNPADAALVSITLAGPQPSWTTSDPSGIATAYDLKFAARSAEVALELITRGRILPTLTEPSGKIADDSAGDTSGTWHARWRPLVGNQDRGRIQALRWCAPMSFFGADRDRGLRRRVPLVLLGFVRRTCKALRRRRYGAFQDTQVRGSPPDGPESGRARSMVGGASFERWSCRGSRDRPRRPSGDTHRLARHREHRVRTREDLLSHRSPARARRRDSTNRDSTRRPRPDDQLRSSLTGESNSPYRLSTIRAFWSLPRVCGRTGQS